MTYKNLKIIILGIIALFFSIIVSADNSTQPKALLLEINSAIDPATVDYIHRGLQQAQQQNAALIILQMDTPGGLDKSMRAIIKDIIASPIPVVTYVAPNGARAASAGTFILYASHIAAMAPGTNLGAATPVELGGSFTSEKDKNDSSKKILDAHQQKSLNDAIAYIRSLAQLRHRNAEWGEKAVREAASLSAPEALKLGVIDIVADNVPNLLQQINGRVVTVQEKQLVLHTTAITVETLSQDWREKLLSVITDPNVAYILLLLGAYGLFFEFVNPGFVLPGVVGGIALLLALYALQLLPINYAGLSLIFLGLIFMGAEIFVPSGALGIGGAIAFIAGSILLLDTQGGFLGISNITILMMSVITIVFFLLLAIVVIRSRRRAVVSGREELIGSIAIVREDFESTGWVKLKGEWWQAKSAVPLKAGQEVRVVKIEGLMLIVEPIFHV